MQHVASRESLIATNNYLLSVADPLDDAGLDVLGREVAAVADMLLVQVPLRRTVSEVTLSQDARAGIVGRVLAGKIGEPALAVVDFAVRQVWSASRDLQEALRRVSRLEKDALLAAEAPGWVEWPPIGADGPGLVKA